MFNFANTLNVTRATEGKKPLLSLGIGAPNIPASPLIDVAMQQFLNEKTQLRAALEKNHSDNDALQKLVAMETYLPSGGSADCCQASADLINRWYPNLSAKASEICIANGCSQALSCILSIFVEPGVKVGSFSPYFPPYATMAKSFGGEYVPVPTSGCRPDLLQLEASLRANPTIDLFILNDPGNPSGCKLSRAELEGIGRVFAKPEFQHIYLVLDETYHEFVFSSDERPFFLEVVPMELFRHRTAIVTCLSKCMGGNPGLRAGFAFTPDLPMGHDLVSIGNKMATSMLNSTCAVSTAIQYVLTHLLNTKLGKGCPKEQTLQQEWESRAAVTYRGMITQASLLFAPNTALPFVVAPEGAFFGIVSAAVLIGKSIPNEVRLLNGELVTDLQRRIGSPTFLNDVHIAYYFIYAAEVVSIPASGFDYDGTRGHLRISFAVSPQQLKDASVQLLHAVQQVK